MRRLSGCAPAIPWVAVLCLFAESSLIRADPSYYVKRATWHETMLASLTALAEDELQDGFEAYESDIVRGGDPAGRVSVNVSGAEALYLFVTGWPDIIWGMATWADAKLIARDGTETSLSHLKTLKVLKGRHSIDMNLHAGLYEGLRIAGREFSRGLHVQANSEVLIPLHGRYERFETWIGIDDWTGTNGNVRFSIVGARTAARRRLWDLVARDFTHEDPRREMRWVRQDRVFEDSWKGDDFSGLAERYARACRRVPPLATEALRAAASVVGSTGLEEVRALYRRSREIDDAIAGARAFPFKALRLAIEDLSSTYEDEYAGGPAYLARLSALESAVPDVIGKVKRGRLGDFERAAKLALELEALRREALMANPLLDFDRLLVIKRKPIGDPRRSQWGDKGLGEYIGLPRQSSWGNGTMPGTDNWDNEIAVLSPVATGGELTTLFKSGGRRLVSDVDLHFDAHKVLFSMPDEHKRWQIYEIDADGKGLRQLTAGDQAGVHCYDGCYLPSGDIAFISTAVLQGVPCNPSVIVGMMYRMGDDGGNIQQLCFEQDHDYYPSVLNNGRILYLRWDYTDTPHVWNRLLMSMNPDGTGQMEYYGSNSYWPNAVFFARAIPGHPSKIVGIVTGHHEGRIGELVVFDPTRGRHEADGVVQRIPGYGNRVEPLIEDKLTEHSWPKFVHPYPLSERYFIVSSKPTPDSLWGIYLVDVFDNMLLLREEEDRVLLEPIPFRRAPKPPAIPDRVVPERKDALVSMVDVYQGPAMEGIPRGTVKSLRLFTYHFGFQTLAGIDHRVGADGPWEIKRVLGHVPVERDGSAFFRIPAKTPISVQPLDAEGKAVALMRSWMTAMPGENLSCVGCHDQQSGTAPNFKTIASRRPPSEIAPWRGPTRGFSFAREVQPVLDEYCAGCHDGKPREDGKTLSDLSAHQGAYVVYQRGNPQGRLARGVPKEELIKKYGGVFEPSYVELRRYVRTGGLESDLHILPPMEFHADTSELVQMLRKGHYGVEIDEEAWDRLIVWIDLNAPCHGTWGEVTPIPGNQRVRRRILRRRYGGLDEDAEETPEMETERVAPVIPAAAELADGARVTCAGWPFDAAEARRRQAAVKPMTRTLDLGGGVTMDLVGIPAGAFVMGDRKGETDERPAARLEITEAFWMGRCEVTNEQFARFDPGHDSRFEHRSSWIFSEAYLGWPLNGPKQPVVRVSWKRAMAFCLWLSERTGAKVTLPTEAQWEYACRAGTDTPLSYGDLDADFSKSANVADASIRDMAYQGWRPKAPDLAPRDDRFDDGALVSATVGRYRPNAWGLHDMHGNVSEWTRTAYRAYPYRQADPGEIAAANDCRVVRGGSWRDRPRRCRSAFRLSYRPYQRVFDVGFRVVCEMGENDR